MIIKREKEKKSILKLALMKVIGRKTAIVAIFILSIVLFMLGILSGLFIGGFFGTIDNPSPSATNLVKSFGLDSHTQVVMKGILSENIKIPFNYISGTLAKKETIYIDIKFEDYRAL